MLAIVLKRRDFRENDQMITLYTREKGKISALARGVKKITGKNSAFLEPFFYVEAEIIPGKDVHHLAKAVGLESYKNIRASLAKSLAAGRVVSLVDRLVEENERDIKIFSLLKNWLDFVNEKSSGPGHSYGFLARLFKIIGFEPALDRCVICGKPRANKSSKTYFSLTRGGVVCADCRGKNHDGSFALLPSADTHAWQLFLQGDITDWPAEISPFLKKLLMNFCEFHGERKLAKFSRIL
jgi:DNA repair protein RecO (recombination protein O)